MLKFFRITQNKKAQTMLAVINRFSIQKGSELSLKKNNQEIIVANENLSTKIIAAVISFINKLQLNNNDNHFFSKIINKIRKSSKNYYSIDEELALAGSFKDSIFPEMSDSSVIEMRNNFQDMIIRQMNQGCKSYKVCRFLQCLNEMDALFNNQNYLNANSIK